MPAAGLRWLVVGSPRDLAEHPVFAALRERWLTPPRFHAFAAATGIDLLRTEHALVAGFDLGTLYMADASGWVAPPDAVFTERLAGSETVHRPHPEVWRITGLVGSTPETLVRIDDELVAVAVGDPTPARVVELRARGRLQSVAPALEGAALSGLQPELSKPSAFAFYALGPFEGQWLTSGAALLAGAEALSLMAELSGERLGVSLAVRGVWDAALDREPLLRSWQALASSPLGRVLTLDRPVEPVRVEVSESQLTLRIWLSAQPFLHGVESLLSADLDGLLGVSSPASSGQLPP